MCDWYLEIAKERIYGDDTEKKKEVSFVLRTVLEQALQLLHPFVPFITEEMYHALGSHDIIASHWPEFEKKYYNPRIGKQFEGIQERVTKARVEKKVDTARLSQEAKEIVNFLTKNIK